MVVDAIRDERFLILPHPEVGEFLRRKGADPERWLAGMRRLQALEAVKAAARPGVTGRALYDVAAEVVEGAGHPTQRTRTPGQALTHGFYFGLGHGVGLEVHEPPSLGPGAHDEVLRAGDVMAIEPGIEGLEGIGGVRFEDLLLVTEDGCETLTDFPYEL